MICAFVNPVEVHRAGRARDRAGAAALTYGRVDARDPAHSRRTVGHTEFLVDISDSAVRADFLAGRAAVAHQLVRLSYARVAGQLVLDEQSDYLCGGGARLSDGLRDILRPLAARRRGRRPPSGSRPDAASGEPR